MHSEKVTVERDPHGTDAHSPGAKLDAGKPMPWLMISGFAHALQAVADVTTKGAQKYTPNGWVSVPDGEARYMEGFGRHTLALARGESHDADTGCLHKAQMIWNLLASLELELRYPAPVVEPVNPTPDGDGWIAWGGGECPVGPSIHVDALHRSGNEYRKERASRSGRWTHIMSPSDIIAYRLSK